MFFFFFKIPTLLFPLLNYIRLVCLYDFPYDYFCFTAVSELWLPLVFRSILHTIVRKRSQGRAEGFCYTVNRMGFTTVKLIFRAAFFWVLGLTTVSNFKSLKKHYEYILLAHYHFHHLWIFKIINNML